MKLIISGTNRPGSYTRKVVDFVYGLYQDLNDPSEIIDLREVPLSYNSQQTYKGPYEPGLQTYIDKIDRASGIIIVCPEYNGSYPGALKFFIDHWNFPRSFESRPVALIGLGGRYGGVRPVDHLAQIFAYRNAYIFPLRVFFFNVWDQFKSESVSQDSFELLKSQAKGFKDFVAALEKSGLDANSRFKV